MTSSRSNGSDRAANDAPVGAGEDTGEDAGEDAGYVETRGPPLPKVAFAVINPLVKLVLRSPLHALLSDSLLLLTFTGRTSGEEYTTPVGYWVRDGRLVVTTHSPWWRNLEGGQPVTVRLRGERRRGVATPHPDSADVAAFVEEFIDRNGTEAVRRLGIDLDGDRAPTREELEAGAGGTVVVEIRLTDGDPADT